MSMQDFWTLKDAVIMVEGALAYLDTATDLRDDEIRKSLNAGQSVAKIAEIAGLSRARIYQIRDGRR